MEEIRLPDFHELVLRFLQIKSDKDASAAAHNAYVNLFNTHILRFPTADDFNPLGETIPQVKAASRLLESTTGIFHRRVDCCIDSCIAFTGRYAELKECPICEQPRYDGRNKPQKTFDYIPLVHRLRLLWANPDQARTMKDYRHSADEDSRTGQIGDYWNGALHQEHVRDGFFSNEHDMALSFSTDGLQLFTVGQYSVWPLLIINLNLPPAIRVKKCNLMLCGIIPGPKSPKDIHSFLQVMIDELKELQAGIPDVYDASTKTSFILRAHLCLVSGDLPAIAKLMGISGTNSYQYCRFCKCKGIHTSHIYCPLQSPVDWTGEPFEYDASNLELRSDDEYREGARHLALPFLPIPPKPVHSSGVAQYSLFYELHTIVFPRSFPIDVMHLVFENVQPKLFKWWTGTFFKKNDDDDDNPQDDLRLPDGVWKQIGKDMETSRKTIPSAFGRALRDIYKYNKSFKAEEWCSFLFLYSPVLLQGRLPPDLYSHYMKLVTAVEMAVDYHLSQDNLARLTILLREFVVEYEQLYYRYQSQRARACLATIHLLLHVAESIKDCGPAWVYWQFPCERVCGMLKAKVKSRIYANRNLSLSLLLEEQFKYLPYTSSYTNQSRQTSVPPFTRDIGGQRYGFFCPKRSFTLSAEESQRLSSYYHRLLDLPSREIGERLSDDAVKFARCSLPGDVDTVGSTWNESRRTNVGYVRLASAIRYTQRYRHPGGHETQRIQYGRVLYFFVHTFDERERMLLFLQRFSAEDLSNQLGVGGAKIVRLVREDGPLEVIGVEAVDVAVGVIESNGKRYIIGRFELSNDPDEVI